MVALESESEFLLDGHGEGLAKLLQLVDEGGNGGLGAENVFLFFVNGFALGNSFLHLNDTVIFLAEGTDALVDETQNRSIGHVRGRHYSPLLSCSGEVAFRSSEHHLLSCRAPFGGRGGNTSGFLRTQVDDKREREGKINR